MVITMKNTARPDSVCHIEQAWSEAQDQIIAGQHRLRRGWLAR
jgi:hypothetical protein